MKYFLVGYMGSGKTHVGMNMAREMGITFIDLDAYITEREKRSITEIFAVKGEAYFRGLETYYLKQVCELYANFVMATGGGLPCFNGNMDYMNEQGHTLFVQADSDTITERLLRNRKKRPLISKLKDEEVKDFVVKHLEERMPYYLQAKETLRNAE